jgi:hypothetical protein
LKEWGSLKVHLFFNAALLYDGFHGRLGATAIHVRGGLANVLGGTHGIGE